jgi:positive regulator of sigma E activity
MLLVSQSIATLLTILLFYAMDFVLIHRYDKKDKPAARVVPGTLRFIFAMVAV